jgi:hypothetical protein
VELALWSHGKGKVCLDLGILCAMCMYQCMVDILSLAPYIYKGSTKSHKSHLIDDNDEWDMTKMTTDGAL